MASTVPSAYTRRPHTLCYRTQADWLRKNVTKKKKKLEIRITVRKSEVTKVAKKRMALGVGVMSLDELVGPFSCVEPFRCTCNSNETLPSSETSW
jgi:hypothetical protein